jgi:hypothetical protein
MEWALDDGGRLEAGFKGSTGDCVVRALAIVTQRPYREVYELVNLYGQRERGWRKRRSSARTGVRRRTIDKIAVELGLQPHASTMGIGTGCRVHLREGELPGGRLVVNLSRHVTAVIDGVIHDTHDPSREGRRCVYGYWELL